MTCKPLIGINADYRSAARNMPAYSYIAAGYFQSVAAAGAIPVVVPPLDDPESIRTLLDRLDGFVLIGGADLDPAQRRVHAAPQRPPARPGSSEASDRMLMAEIAGRRECPSSASGPACS
jgi:putative glutamine amidotransferase